VPELPEVETTRRGLSPVVIGKVVRSVIVRVPKLRQTIPAALPDVLVGQRILDVKRRAKYLLFCCTDGTLLLHLGMTGYLWMVFNSAPPGRHDHIELIFDDGSILRFNDSRRFGTLLWIEDDPLEHSLLAHLGPEPLDGALNGAYLARLAQGRKLCVKAFIMDQSVVAGVGNIYASEALFRARILPQTPAGQLHLTQWQALRDAIKTVLAEAIAAGATTLHAFRKTEKPLGYFPMTFKVYGRAGEPCPNCGRPLLVEKIGQRSSYYCCRCQR